MGHSASYQAIPEDGDLYRLLATDRDEAMVLETLWPNGCYPIDLRECADEVAESLKHNVDGDEAELAALRVAFDRLEATIERTCAEHFDRKGRSAFVEKVHDPIRRWAESRWVPLGREDGPRFAEIVISGQ